MAAIQEVLLTPENFQRNVPDGALWMRKKFFAYLDRFELCALRRNTMIYLYRKTESDYSKDGLAGFANEYAAFYATISCLEMCTKLYGTPNDSDLEFKSILVKFRNRVDEAKSYGTLLEIDEDLRVVYYTTIIDGVRRTTTYEINKLGWRRFTQSFFTARKRAATNETEALAN